jgi:hypothetical protein
MHGGGIDTTVGHTVGTAIALNPVAIGVAATILASTVAIYCLVSKSGRAKKLRQEQTKAASTLFMKECFDDWAGIRKTEQAV